MVAELLRRIEALEAGDAKMNEVMRELRQLRVEVRELAFNRAGAVLVATIHRLAGNRVFCARELTEHGAQVPALAAALIASVGTASNARRVGHFLRRIEGIDMGGVRVVRVGSDRDGLLWIVETCELPSSNPLAR